MKDYTSEAPVFSESISIVENTDLVNAENNNAAVLQLLQNDLVLKETKVDKEEGKRLVSESERKAWNETYQQATGYTDSKIAELINGAPATLDTLGEIAAAMQANENVVEALDAAIGKKANKTEMESLLGTKLEKTGDSKDNTVTFTSSDTLTSSGWTDVAVLKSGETHKSFAQKVSTMFKNLRYLKKLLGSTDISAIGDGTVTGALNALNTGMYISYFKDGSLRNYVKTHVEPNKYLMFAFHNVSDNPFSFSNGYAIALWSFPLSVSCGVLAFEHNINKIEVAAVRVYTD